MGQSNPGMKRWEPVLARQIAAGAFLLLSAALASAQDASTDREQIVHVLNRTTFGPRPGDVEMVEKMGVRAYIEQQLHPEQIDDSAVENKLAALDMLQKSPAELLGIYKDERQMNKDKKQEKTADTATPANNSGPTPNMQNPAVPPPPTLKQKLQFVAALIRSASVVGQLQQDKLIRAVESPRQLQGSPGRFLGQPLQHRRQKKARPRAQGRGRPRRHPPAHSRQLPRSSRGLGQKPCHAGLPRQRAEQRRPHRQPDGSANDADDPRPHDGQRQRCFRP